MLTERNQIGKREMLADYITRVDAKKKPCVAMMSKGKPFTNMLSQYQVDDFEDAEDISVETTRDVEGFDDASANRALLKTVGMKVRDAAMVDDAAENVSDVAGESRGELAESIMKKLEKVGRCIEAFICGDFEQQEQGTNVKWRGRGLGIWIGPNSAQTQYPVPDSYVTPAGSIDSTAINAITPTIANNLLQSSYEKTGEESVFDGLFGPKLRRQFSSFSQTQFGTTNTTSIMRMYQTQFSGLIDNVVDQFQGDFGRINIHSTLWNAHPNFGGTAAKQARRGYLLLMKLLLLRYKRKPRVKQLEDRGGGPRFLVDALVMWEVKNPLPLAAFTGTTGEPVQ